MSLVMCVCSHGVYLWCACVVSAQLTIEKDKLKEAQRLVRESEAKVGVLFACVAFNINLRFNHNEIQVKKEENERYISFVLTWD